MFFFLFLTGKLVESGTSLCRMLLVSLLGNALNSSGRDHGQTTVRLSRGVRVDSLEKALPASSILGF